LAAPHNLVRDQRGVDLLEMMLVFAVVTVLLIRVFLALTGYPQVGGGGLHIAHMLWGGLGMLAAVSLLLTFWSPAMRQLAAAIGGVGFGFFIDELGKFITSDNDYFFQPTIALMYVLFVLLFLAISALRAKPLSRTEVQANKRIVAAMSAQGQTSIVNRVYNTVDGWLRSKYLALVRTRWFAPALSILFAATAVTQIVTVVRLVALGAPDGPVDRHIPLLEQVASGASTVFVIAGVLLLRRSRLSAYRWFKRSALVNILVTQVFMFCYNELAALGGLLGQVLIYVALNVLIEREEDLAEAR